MSHDIFLDVANFVDNGHLVKDTSAKLVVIYRDCFVNSA